MAKSTAACYPLRVTDQLLRDVARRIVEHFHPDKIILFGSRAWGSPGPDSDVDLLVVMETDKRPAVRSAEVSLACRPKFLPMDILVRTPAEVERRLRINDPFIRQIVEKGRVLYER